MRNTVQCTQYFIPHSLQRNDIKISFGVFKKIKKMLVIYLV